MWQQIRSLFVAAEAQNSDALRPCSTIVSILLDEQDRSLITKVCEGNQWDVFFANSGDEARQVAEKIKPPIILLDRDMADGDWRHALSAFASASSEACIILISRVADDYLWNEVVCNGGYDVLSKPLREQDVLRAVRLAWFYWNSIRQDATIPRK